MKYHKIGLFLLFLNIVCYIVFLIIPPSADLTDNYIVVTAQKYSKKLDYNRDIIAIVDWSRPSNEHRFFLVSLKKQEIIYSGYTSHGTNTGPREKAIKFSNIPESHMSSLGVMRVSETYYGSSGYSVRLDGLSKGVNDNVRNRFIVLHPAGYVSEKHMRTRAYPGRSLGCLTLDPNKSRWVIDQLKNGGLIVNVRSIK